MPQKYRNNSQKNIKFGQLNQIVHCGGGGCKNVLEKNGCGVKMDDHEKWDGGLEMEDQKNGWVLGICSQMPCKTAPSPHKVFLTHFNLFFKLFFTLLCSFLTI